MNHDNALPSIARLSLVEKTSKVGNLYTEGILHLNNDYQIRVEFLAPNLITAIKESLKLAKKQTLQD